MELEFVYQLCSSAENRNLIFKTQEKAKSAIKEKEFMKFVFPKSKQEDLFIMKRTIL